MTTKQIQDKAMLLLEKIARSACLDQRMSDRCICFSCEAQALLRIAAKN